MTLPIRSNLPFRLSLNGAVLLALTAGCEWDYKEALPRDARTAERGVFGSSQPSLTKGEPERLTTVTSFELRQQYEHDEQTRHFRQQAWADEAREHRIRFEQQREELRRRWDDQVEEDRRRTQVRQAERQRQEERRQRLDAQAQQRRQADAQRSQQPSRTLDQMLWELQVQQEQYQQSRMLQRQNMGSNGNSHP